MSKYYPEILELRLAIEESVQRKMKAPSDFEFLAGVVWERIRENISPTTLKRLWGYVDGGDKTRNSTLNILSKFVGYNDWDGFLAILQEKNEVQSNLIVTDKIESKSLNIGNKLEITWQPNRHCIVEYLGDNHFQVVSSEHSKLKAFDTFDCYFFLNGHPLYIDNLEQGNDSSVSFVAGTKGGIKVKLHI